MNTKTGGSGSETDSYLRLIDFVQGHNGGAADRAYPDRPLLMSGLVGSGAVHTVLSERPFGGQTPPIPQGHNGGAADRAYPDRTLPLARTPLSHALALRGKKGLFFFFITLEPRVE